MNKLEKELLNTNYIIPYGRTYFNDDSLILSFSYTGIKYSFVGTKTIIHFDYDLNNEQHPYIAIFIDKQFLTYLDLRNSEMIEVKNEIIIDNLDNGKHTIIIHKLSEVDHRLSIKSIDCDGHFVIPNKHKYDHKIEIYGDSLTCGLGLLGNINDPNYYLKDENVILSYGIVASSLLQDETSLISISGFPLYKSPYNENSIIKNIPSLLNLSDFHHQKNINDLPKYCHQLFNPDLIIINLGANDKSYLDIHNDELDEFIINFKKQYIQFIKDLKIIHPSSKILLLTFKRYTNKTINKAIDEIYKQLNDPNIYRLSIKLIGNYRFGSGYHPSQYMHLKYANNLVEFIKDNIFK